jgi:hypothetical protein
VGLCKAFEKSRDHNFIFIEENFTRSQIHYEWRSKKSQNTSSYSGSIGTLEFSGLPGKFATIMVAVVIVAYLVLIASAVAIHNVDGADC